MILLTYLTALVQKNRDLSLSSAAADVTYGRPQILALSICTENETGEVALHCGQ